MNPEDADLVLALERCPEVDGVYALPSAPAGWPRVFVALHEDSGHALGVVTGIMVRALPHRDRSHIGVAATERLREIWVPLGASERRDAQHRAEERERAYRAQPTPFPRIRVDVEEPPPVSVPVIEPFQPHTVWRLADGRVAVLEVVADPFREQPPVLLVVTDDDALYGRIARAAPRQLKLERARTAREAVDAISNVTPAHIVCSEAAALAPDGLLEWIEHTRPALVERFEVIADEGTADWLASYLEKRAKRHLEILEEPIEDEAIDELVSRARSKR